MRLWHKDLISVLPRKQLLGQWRECCVIASNIKNKGTPNHLLVNKIMDYPLDHFYKYAEMVYNECKKRGYKVKFETFDKYFPHDRPERVDIADEELFAKWHNNMYFRQCYYNLEEKYCCGGIDGEVLRKILGMRNIILGSNAKVKTSAKCNITTSRYQCIYEKEGYCYFAGFCEDKENNYE